MLRTGVSHWCCTGESKNSAERTCETMSTKWGEVKWRLKTGTVSCFVFYACTLNCEDDYTISELHKVKKKEWGISTIVKDISATVWKFQ